MSTQQKEYVISFKKSVQISPDEWDAFPVSLKVKGQTTIQEIIDWFHRHYNQDTIPVNGLCLSQLDLTPNQEVEQK